MHQISIICLWVCRWNIHWLTVRHSGIAVSAFRSIFVDSSTIAGRSEPSRLSVGRLSDQSQRLPAGHGAAHCRQTAPITPVTHCRKLPTLHEVFFSLAFSDVPQPLTYGLAKCLHKVKWSPTAVSCQLYDRFFRLFLLLSPLTLISPKVGLIDTNNCLFQALPYVL